MTRRLVLLCLVATAAHAQEYERLLADARRLLADESRPVGERFDAQYERLGQVALAHPDRWEAYFERGENRCNRAYHFRAEADIRLADARATGMDDETMAMARKEVEAQIDRWRAEAYREFSVAEDILRRERLWRPDHEILLFANAAMKFAGREYMRTHDGKRGAIEDFKELARRGFQPDRCMSHIALCYLDAGHEAYLKDDADEAQRLWDEGLKWAKNRFWRRV
ncbi:MAG: hypothetical protein HUU41_16115, partial [Bryobacteraceae bacterium]|nr:hypothetical protein [Bryobacteraceae bacterium]